MELSEVERMWVKVFGLDRPTCATNCHIYWFDQEDVNPVLGWYTCRDCGFIDPVKSRELGGNV